MTASSRDACWHDLGADGSVPFACLYCGKGSSAGGKGHVGIDGMPRPAWLAHLYECQGLSTYRIAEQTGLNRQHVARTLRGAGVAVRPRGTGRLRPVRRPGEPAGSPRLIRQLYEQSKLSSRQIGEILGMPERTVRDRLRRYGISARTRGGWERADRTTVPAEALELLYGQLGMTAAEVGQRLGMSGSIVLRSAHVLGLPVRAGGAVLLPGPAEIELIGALYADPLIDSVLTEHGLPRVPPGSSISDRFPDPVPLTTPLVKDLYWGCGVGLSHIELLTGQAAESVRGFMIRAGIPLRQPGGRSPFRRRWRARESEDLT